MAKIIVPPNVGMVRVAMGLGGKYTVWNGKQGKDEFKLHARDRKHAEALAAAVNKLRQGGEIDVHG